VEPQLRAVRPLATFETGARVAKPSAKPFDFAYGRAGAVCRDGDLIGVLYDGAQMVIQYSDDTEFAPAPSHSVAIQRLIDEVRLDPVTRGASAYDRGHNRHNR
jgi:hypothetical protein